MPWGGRGGMRGGEKINGGVECRTWNFVPGIDPSLQLTPPYLTA